MDEAATRSKVNNDIRMSENRRSNEKMAAKQSSSAPSIEEIALSTSPAASSYGKIDLAYVDEAFSAAKQAKEEALILDDRTSRRLRLRADLIIMPILCLTYAIQFLDRTTLSYASIMGFNKDLHLHGQEYSWLGSIYFFGFFAAEFLTGRLLQRLPIAKYLGCSLIAWGALLCCTAAIKSYGAGLAIRFLLGMLHACVSPAMVLIVSQWYTKKEQVTRTAIWVSASGFAQIFGGLVSYGLVNGNKENHWSLATWKVTYLLFGLLAVFIGMIVLVFLPDNQLNAWWLSPTDKILAVERVRVNQQGVGNKVFKMYQLKETVFDPLTWMIFLFAIAVNVPNGGLTNFFSQLIVSFGYTAPQAQLYSTPAGAVSIALCAIWALTAQRWNCRILMGIAALLVAIIGSILIVAIPIAHPSGRLAGFYLTMGIPIAEGSVLSVISVNVAGYTRKTTMVATFFVGYCIGNIIGPQTFRAKDAPHYVSAEVTIIVLLSVCALDLFCMYVYLRWQNRKKEAMRARPDYIVHTEDSEFLDLTDKENKEFVYSL